MPRNDRSLLIHRARSLSETRSRVTIALLSSLLALLMAGCSSDEPTSAPVDASAATASTASVMEEAVPVPPGEPPADVVRDLIFEQYAEMEKAGGMPATMTATGQGLQLRAHLFDARKEKCLPVPQAPNGEFECHLTINLALTGDGSDPAFEEPSEQGARIGVKWDPSGKWVRE